MAELSVLLAGQSFFSEGRATIAPKRQVQLAKARGYTALGLVDWCSVAGAVELFSAAQATEPFPLVSIDQAMRPCAT